MDKFRRGLEKARTGLSMIRFLSSTCTTFGQNNSLPTDVKRFLEEVGSDPKEARFWLRQFQQQANDPERPFAVLQAGSSILNNEKAMESLCSSLSFLNRNGMPTVLVYGPDQDHQDDVFIQTEQLQQQGMQLVDCLEKSCHATTRAFCGSSGILASRKSHSRTRAVIERVNADPITWTFRSGLVPLLSSISIDQKTGVVTPVCSRHVAIKLSEVLKPMKVIFLNDYGGLVDDRGKVVSHIKIPGDVPGVSEQAWCTSDMKRQIDEIATLLKDFSNNSTAVITSPDNIIKELFSHQGCGTMIQKTEAIRRYKSLDEVDVPRLTKLLAQSFQKPLKPDHMTVIQEYLQSVYISENYTAAAIVIHDREKSEIPYLDKFVITSTCQGQGTSDDLWNHLTQDFPSLFWRSRATNRINPWYFIRADGSWTNGDWIIFWYGVDEPKISHSLVKFAGNLPDSFDPIAKHDVTMKSENRSTTSYIRYV